MGLPAGIVSPGEPPDGVGRAGRSSAFLLEPPQVVHRERIAPDALAAMRPAWDQVYFPPRNYCLSVVEDVFVAAEGLVLRRDGTVIEESVTQHSTDEVAWARAAVSDVARQAAWPQLHGTLVLCRKRGVQAYGHWLIEALPMAFVARQWPGPLRFFVQALVGPIAAVIGQSLAQLGVDGDRIVAAGNDPVWVERLVMVHGLTDHGVYMSPVAVQCVNAMTASIEPVGAEAIFIVRAGSIGRGLMEEARIVADARRAGFAIIDPATMSFDVQVATFKRARHIVGVMGSALANLAFCRPDTRVVVLAPDTMPDTFFWFLAGHRGLDITEVRCRTVAVTDGAQMQNMLVLDPADQEMALGRHGRSAPVTAWFDPVFYAAIYPDVARSGDDLLQHYMDIGWREGRLPSRHFDGARYLAVYADVAANGINPRLHFLLHGRAEGRAAFALPMPNPS